MKLKTTIIQNGTRFRADLANGWTLELTHDSWKNQWTACILMQDGTKVIETSLPNTLNWKFRTVHSVAENDVLPKILGEFAAASIKAKAYGPYLMERYGDCVSGGGSRLLGWTPIESLPVKGLTASFPDPMDGCKTASITIFEKGHDEKSMKTTYLVQIRDGDRNSVTTSGFCIKSPMIAANSIRAIQHGAFLATSRKLQALTEVNSLIRDMLPIEKGSRKHIFILNGSGGVGKDTFADFVSEYARTMHVSAITPAKELAKQIGWTGAKTEKDRKLLSDLKALMIDYNDYPTIYLAKQVEAFRNDPDIEVLFIDIREPEEIGKAVSAFGAKTVLVTNRNVGSIVSNDSDRRVYDYEYDYHIENDGTLDELKEAARKFCERCGIKT